jgi:hypothetical protein
LVSASGATLTLHGLGGPASTARGGTDRVLAVAPTVSGSEGWTLVQRPS